MTGQEVFDSAIYLMDWQDNDTGSTDTTDTRDYKYRAMGLINSMLDRVFPASDNYVVGKDGRRPYCPKLTSLDDDLYMDERVCSTVLTFGLAGLLLTEENPISSAYFLQTYEANLKEALASVPCVESGVADVYGGIEYGEFSRW